MQRYSRSVVLQVVLVYGRSEEVRLFHQDSYPGMTDLGLTCSLPYFTLVEFGLAKLHC
jgi:hypothetical protein